MKTEAEHEQRWPTYDGSAPPDHERAASYIAIDDFVDPDEDENVRRCYRALAAEKERVRALRTGLHRILADDDCDVGVVAEQALAADDAKAAGEPECGGHCHHTKEYGFVPEAGCPVHDAPIADRASRRLAYVRKHAARFLRAYIRAGCSADLSRANAIEQAGLIFDETEQSE